LHKRTIENYFKAQSFKNIIDIVIDHLPNCIEVKLKNIKVLDLSLLSNIQQSYDLFIDLEDKSIIITDKV
jgi:hypothetical protein